MRRISKVALIAAATTALALGGASAAQAAVTIDDAGKGFIGKGDVQTALGYNNTQMQANASKLKFTTSQDATQTVTQALTQSGAQSATNRLSSTASNSASRPPSRK